MKSQRKAWLAAGVLALGASACFSDPTSDLRSGPTALQLSRTYVVQNVNDTDVVNVQVLDDQGNPLPLTGVTYTSADPTVATMAGLPDTLLRDVPGLTLTKAIIVAVNPGTTTINVTANGVSSTITVLSFPTSFAGAVTPTTVAEGDLITIASTSVVTFLPTTTATVGGQAAFIQSVSATSLVLYAPVAGTAQNIVISGLQLLGSIPIATLTASTPVTITAGANATITTGPVVAIPATVGAMTEVVGAVDASGNISDYFTINAVTGDSVEITVDWIAPTGTDYDIDFLFWNAAGTGVVSCAGCTGANPERMRRRLTAATTYRIEVQMYDPHGQSVPKSYRLRVIRRA